jgi:hypothetical protein
MAGLGVGDRRLPQDSRDRRPGRRFLLECALRELAVLRLIRGHGLVEQRALVAERGVQARRADAERGGEVGDRRRVVAPLPERQQRLLERRLAVERPGTPAPAAGGHADHSIALTKECVTVIL